MAITATPTNYSNLISGKLAAPITAAQTTGITVTMDTVQIGSRTAAPVTIPSGVMLLKLSRKTRTKTIVEYIGVEAGSTQSGATATLGTTIRDLSTTDGTSFTTQSSGASWPAGSTTVELVWTVQHAENTAFKNNSNTFTADQTISANLSIGSQKYVDLGDFTTEQETGLPNGAIWHNTDLNAIRQKLGGSISTVATGSVVNAADGTAGKVDLATAAEVAAGTATDASSGGPNVIPVSIVKTSSTGAVNGTVPALNSAVSLDVTIGGTGRTSVTSGGLLVGAGTSAMTVIGPGSANQVPLSNGTTIAMSNLKYYSQVVYLGYSDSGTLSNPTSETTLDTHNYAISANDLINGVAYEYEAVFSYAWGAGSLQIDTCFGTTSLLGGVPTLGTPGGAGTAYQKGVIWGTAAAGASVAVRAVAYSGFNNAVTNRCDYASTNVATNGSLTLQWRALFGASNGTNSIKLVAVTIKKLSTTAF